MSKFAEQITAFEQKRAALVSANEAIMEKAAADGATLDAEQQECFDNNQADIKAIDDHLKRLRDMEKAAADSAKPVDGQNEKQGTTSRVPAQVKTTPKLDPGIAVARIARAKAVAAVKGMTQKEAAASLYGEDSATFGFFAKAAVAPALTSDPSWAGNLVGEETSVFADFVEYLRPQTILGRFGQNGIPSLRTVGFRVPLIGQTSGGSGYWVGEGQAKPLTAFDFTRTTLEPLKVANIAVASKEVLEYSSPSADAIIRDSLVAALRERLDIDFIDPSKAAVSGVSPASITNGVTPVASSGSDADAVRADIRAAFAGFIAANNAPTSGVWIMSATNALSLSLMQNPLGQAEFPGIGMNGGTLFGLPAIVSEHMGDYVVLVNASDIYVGDEGGFSVDFSREASLQMDSAPDNPTTDATVLVSLWQRNLVGFLAERTINWAKRRASSVQVISDVAWGAPDAS